MKVLLISANSERAYMPVPPLGLLCVAQASLEAGHEIVVVDLMAEEDMDRRLKDAISYSKPDVIGISVRNIDDQDMRNPRILLDQSLDATRVCRTMTNAHIVVGGPGYSMFPEDALAYLGADIGIVGDGEDSFPMLLDRLEQGGSFAGIPGVVFPGDSFNGERDRQLRLDRFPTPDPELLDRSAYNKDELWVPVQSRRGCPLDCAYCSTASIEGRIIRKRSPGEVVRWMERWVDAGFHRFHFVDNTFNLPASYAEALCDSICESGLSVEWLCILYPAGLTDRLAGKMAKAGCRHVSLGFESGSTRMLRAFKKRFGPEEIRQAERMLSDHGIRKMGFLLLGGPGETRRSVEESFEFVDSLDLDMVKVTVGIRLYPNTHLARLAVQKGLISETDSLLMPRFYLEEGLSGWLEETADAWMAERKHWQG